MYKVTKRQNVQALIKPGFHEIHENNTEIAVKWCGLEKPILLTVLLIVEKAVNQSLLL